MDMGNVKYINILYATLISYDKESSKDRMRAWSLDIKEDIEETEWSKACLKAQIQTINTRMKLLQQMVDEDIHNP